MVFLSLLPGSQGGWGRRDSEQLCPAEAGWYALPYLVSSGQNNRQIVCDLPPLNKKLVPASGAVTMVIEGALASVVGGNNKQPQNCSPGALGGLQYRDANGQT